MNDKIGIKNINVNTIIGINDRERIIKQPLKISMVIYCKMKDDIEYNYSDICKKVINYVENSCFYTLECLANNLAQEILIIYKMPKISITIKKPQALRKADYPYVTITRSYNDQLLQPQLIEGIYLGLGSNIGNRYDNILSCLKNLKQNGINIIETSYMYETNPMYITNQNKFYNMVCKVQFNGTPINLLKIIKDIEKGMGRVDTIRNGPRIIDIDILYFNNDVIFSDELIIPHPRIMERSFVIRPLLDLDPTIIESDINMDDVVRVIPLKHNKQIKLDEPFIMKVINATPDSFSGDGTINQSYDYIKGYEDICDIGGESTRPGHEIIEADEEIKRISSVYNKILGIKSIDTRKSVVAEHFLGQDVDIINDVSGLTYDSRIIDLVIKHQCPIVICHWSENRDIGYKDMIDDLSEMAVRMEKYGLYKWNIILDPGIGFNKPLELQRDIWDNLDKLVVLGYPVLIGGSRYLMKNMIDVDNLDNKDMDMAINVLMCKAVEKGVLGLRVHNSRNTRIMLDLIKR